MWNNVIGRQIRRANRNLLTANLVLILTLVVLAVINGRYLFNYLQGPARISNADLLKVTDPDRMSRYYVTIEGEKSFSSGVTEVEQEQDKYTHEVKSETTTAHYLILKIGDRALIVKSPAEAEQTRFTGALTPIPDDIQSRIVADVESKEPQLHGLFLPVMLDATDFKFSGMLELAIGTPLFLIGGWNILKSQRRSAEPGEHPIAKSLARFGDPRDVVLVIDRDMSLNAQRIGSKTTLGKDWMLHETTFGADILPLEELAWAYKKVTQHRTNFIPTGKTFAALLYLRNGRQLEIQSSQQESEALLMEIAKRAPWIVMGYAPDLLALWNKNRTGFLAAVDERRQAMTAAPSPVDQESNPVI